MYGKRRVNDAGYARIRPFGKLGMTSIHVFDTTERAGTPAGKHYCTGFALVEIPGVGYGYAYKQPFYT